MSQSLSFDCWRCDEPAATDPVEKRTWAALRIVVQGQCATQFWDKHTDTTAEVVYVPTFPIAQWIVRNWWALFYEPCRHEAPPPEALLRSEQQRRWAHRHCLRSAESGLFLPYLHIYSNGAGVSIHWYEDTPHGYPSAPGRFLYSGLTQLDVRHAKTALSEFVSKVLGWCEGLDDERVRSLRADWRAVTDADEQEQSFCRAAGRLGLDPYAIDEWEEGLVDFLATDLGTRIDDAIVGDLLESVAPVSANASWTWASKVERDLGISSGKMPQINAGIGFRTAKDQGYFIARQVRQITNLDPEQPVDSLRDVSLAIGGVPVCFEPHNHVPSNEILAAVGWRGPNHAILAGPEPSHLTSLRFLEARGLYLTMVGCHRGARLITRARTWDQQAARSFAAELLAPQEALARHARPEMGPEERFGLLENRAAHYKVSTEVIRLQLQNQGVWQNLDD